MMKSSMYLSINGYNTLMVEGEPAVRVTSRDYTPILPHWLDKKSISVLSSKNGVTLFNVTLLVVKTVERNFYLSSDFRFAFYIHSLYFRFH